MATARSRPPDPTMRIMRSGPWHWTRSKSWRRSVSSGSASPATTAAHGSPTGSPAIIPNGSGGLPERLIGAEPEFFLRHSLGSWARDPAAFEPEVFAEYLRCFKNPETIRATCDEYRAGASIDLEHDRADRGRRITIPLLMLRGKRSSQGSGYDVLGVWRDHAENVHGHAIDSGHFIPEEAPDEAYRSLRDFFASDRV